MSSGRAPTNVTRNYSRKLSYFMQVLKSLNILSKYLLYFRRIVRFRIKRECFIWSLLTKVKIEAIFTARQRSCGKLMFSLMSVCPHGVPCDYYPWCIGSHCTGALPLPQDMRHWDPQTSSRHGTWAPASDIEWSRLETRSNLFIWGLPLPC